MYDRVQNVIAILLLTTPLLIFVCIGQWIGLNWPEAFAPLLGVAFCLSMILVLGGCLAMYDVGFEAASKEQEPDEDTSAD